MLIYKKKFVWYSVRARVVYIRAEFITNVKKVARLGLFGGSFSWSRSCRTHLRSGKRGNEKQDRADG